MQACVAWARASGIRIVVCTGTLDTVSRSGLVERFPKEFSMESISVLRFISSYPKSVVYACKSLGLN